jgi:hypothetical protein
MFSAALHPAIAALAESAGTAQLVLGAQQQAAQVLGRSRQLIWAAGGQLEF